MNEPSRVHSISHFSCTAKQRWSSLEKVLREEVRTMPTRICLAGIGAEYCKYHSFPQGNQGDAGRDLENPETRKTFITSSLSLCKLSVSFQDKSVFNWAGRQAGDFREVCLVVAGLKLTGV